MEKDLTKERAMLYADAIIAENFTKAADILELMSELPYSSYSSWRINELTGVDFYSIKAKISELRKR